MNKKGFTLIELLVVVAIIGILAAVGVVAYNGYTASAKTAAAKSNLKSFQKLPFNTNELAWRHSISYTNDSDVGFINISTYLENIRIRSCFKTPCNDSKNNQALEIDVVE
jgi:prepilin-type N-terminal cleavage/methylation domain-containing protein